MHNRSVIWNAALLSSHYQREKLLSEAHTRALNYFIGFFPEILISIGKDSTHAEQYRYRSVIWNDGLLGWRHKIKTGG
jgi:hypothetical protein